MRLRALLFLAFGLGTFGCQSVCEEATDKLEECELFDRYNISSQSDCDDFYGCLAECTLEFDCDAQEVAGTTYPDKSEASKQAERCFSDCVVP